MYFWHQIAIIIIFLSPIFILSLSIFTLTKLNNTWSKYLFYFTFALQLLLISKFTFSLCTNCDLGNSPLGYYWFFPFLVFPVIIYNYHILYKLFKKQGIILVFLYQP